MNIAKQQPWLRAWEGLLLISIATVLLVGGNTETAFLTEFNLVQAMTAAAPVAVMVLSMTYLIVAGEIDLSVASTLGLCSCVLGWTTMHHWPLALALCAMFLTGALAGAFNGLLVVRIGLPSLVVTLGTLALYSGLASIVLGGGQVSNFGSFISGYGANGPIGWISWPTLTFLVLLAPFAAVLQLGRIGRAVYAVGGNSRTAMFSGVAGGKVRFWLFTTSGVMSAVAALILTAYLSNATAATGSGLELNVIAVVVLGGVSIYGGKGRLTAVLLALALYVLLTNLLTLKNVSSDDQQIVIGGLLIISVVLPRIGGRAIATIRRHRQATSSRPVSSGP
jgi:rhamnose transport system permease protein